MGTWDQPTLTFFLSHYLFPFPFLCPQSRFPLCGILNWFGLYQTMFFFLFLFCNNAECSKSTFVHFELIPTAPLIIVSYAYPWRWDGPKLLVRRINEPKNLKQNKHSNFRLRPFDRQPSLLVQDFIMYEKFHELKIILGVDLVPQNQLTYVFSMWKLYYSYFARSTSQHPS